MFQLATVLLVVPFLSDAAREPVQDAPVKPVIGGTTGHRTSVLLQNLVHLKKQHFEAEAGEVPAMPVAATAKVSPLGLLDVPPEWRSLGLVQVYKQANVVKASVFALVLGCVLLRLVADCMQSDERHSTPRKEKGQAAPTPGAVAETKQRRAELRLTGMTCSACSSTIERCLQNHHGVTSASVNLVMERATIVYDGAKSSVAQLIEEVEDVGFDASVISDGASEDACSAGQAELHLSVKAAAGARHAEQASEGGDPEDARDSLSQALDGIEGVLAWKALGDGAVRVAYRPSELGARDLLNRVRDVVPTLEVSCAPPQEDEQMVELQRQADKLWICCKRSSIPAAAVLIITLILPACDIDLGSIYCWQMQDRPIHLHVATLFVLVLATPVQFFYGAEFHRQARKALQRGSPNMDVLVSLATNLAFGYATLAFINKACNMFDSAPHGGHPAGEHHQDHHAVIGLGCHSLHFFGMAPILMAVVLTGKFLEVQAKMQTMESLMRLMDCRNKTARLVTANGKEECIPVELVQEGDTLRLQEGNGVPADGVLTSDEPIWVSEAILTGESAPVEKARGSLVMGGSTVLTGVGTLQTSKVGSQTVLGEMRTLISNAQATKSRAQEVANVVARYFVTVVMIVSVMVFFIWLHVVRSGRVALPNDMSADDGLDQVLFAAKFGMAVLMVACPCAMGLATPTAVMVATGVAARMGCLVKSAEALETGAQINAIVLDKTGTITTGQPVVQGVFFVPPGPQSPATDALKEAAAMAEAAAAPAHEESRLPAQDEGCEAERGSRADADDGGGCPEGCSSRRSSPRPARPDWCASAVSAALGDDEKASYERAFWQLVGMTEAASSHPLARCIVETASAAVGCGSFPEAKGFRSVVGKGVCAVLGESEQFEIRVGSLAYLEETCAVKGRSFNSSAADVVQLQRWVESMRAARHSVVVVHLLAKTEVCVLGAVAMRDEVRPKAAAVIRHIQQDLGIQVWMCTGDGATTAHAIAAEVGIRQERVIAEALPAKKAAQITAIRDEAGGHAGGARVCMVGDGVNDGPALACADLGLAVGAGAQLAMDAADVIIVQSDLPPLLAYLQLCKATAATIRRNFAWAFVFNFCGLPLAAGLFYPKVVMPPLIAGVAMGLSSTLVVWSSLALRSFQPHRWEPEPCGAPEPSPAAGDAPPPAPHEPRAPQSGGGATEAPRRAE